MVASLFKKWSNRNQSDGNNTVLHAHAFHYFNIMSLAAQSAFLHCRPSCIFFCHTHSIAHMGTTMEMVAAKAGCCKGRKELLSLTTIQKLQHQTTACSGDFFPHDKPKWCARNCVITQKFALCFIFFMMMMSMMIKINNNDNYDDDDGRRFHVLP